jgi:hypothetical protein
MFYLRDAGNQTRIANATTDKQGRAKISVPADHVVSFVEPIPSSGFWIMLADSPPSGSTIDCLPIAKSKSGGAGWWHNQMNIDVTSATRGAGINVGVIDTGCGPHPNLKQVTLVGTVVDGQTMAANTATDVAQHGTHTTRVQNQPDITVLNSTDPHMVTIEASPNAADQLSRKLGDTYYVEPEVRRHIPE